MVTSTENCTFEPLTQERDYFEHLFTPELSQSDLSNSTPKPDTCTFQIPKKLQHGIGNLSVDQDPPSDLQHGTIANRSMQDSRDYYENLFTPETMHSPISVYNHNFSFDTSTPTFQFDFENSSEKVNKIYDAPPNSVSSTSQLSPGDSHNNYIKTSELPNDTVDDLLGFNQPLPEIMKPENSPTSHMDTIATFNIQNKFDHTKAAELMLKENITFLALQEPYAAQHEHNPSWNAYTKGELQATRIDCFESQYQIILIDTWKWGGKTICEFSAHLSGRITSIALEFGDGKKLGIITIYNSSAEVHNNETHGINGKIINIYEEITDKWKSEFPGIDIIILGDFQETCSTSSQDNFGTFRKEKKLEGLLSQIEETHVSLIRQSLDAGEKYLTRFGKSGARGIDHIMVHQNPKTQKLFSSPRIRRHEGNTYFPSDHALLTCDYSRNDKNNNEDGICKMKFDYSKISRIKLKGSGKYGRDIRFDESQFKDSDSFRNQANLYSQLQKITSNSSDFSNYHLNEIEARLDGLSKNLWQCGIDQKIDGKSNKLVEITEHHATELAYTYRKFKYAIEEVMDKLKLAHPKDNLESAGKTRGRIRTGKGFRLFKNLPISTKIRYLRNGMKTKLRLIQKAQIWLKEFKIKETEGINEDKEKEFWTIRDSIVKTNDLLRQAQVIEEKLDSECLERENHMNAIKYSLINGKQTSRGKQEHDHPDTSIISSSSNSEKTNIIPHLSGSIHSLLNSWLLEAGCKNGFITANQSSIHGNIASSIADWKIPLTTFIEAPNLLDNDESWIKINEQLEESEKKIRNLITKITNMQIRYRKNTLHYFLNVNTINSFTQKVLQKERSAPATHTIIWDEEQENYRPCKNEIEELQATRDFHGNWMSDSKAKENCAFASVIRKGKLGPRGIRLTPDRKITMNDIPALVHKGKKLSRKVKRAFIKAHNKFTARLFRAPKKPRKEFFYPFFYTENHKTMNNSKLIERKLWKSITAIPSKARHDGYHIAVLGRFDSRWRSILLKFIEIMLIMRYIPSDMKKIARYPIPKPGKVNEYRPISLCDDLYCFLNGIITQITSNAIEKSKLLHEGITSYRRGKSCATLVTIEQCFREDCVEGNKPTVQIDEDEEKFFDRVCLEIILAVMKINGFPDAGFVELKACMMGLKLVEIVTSKGTVYATFQCGLEQGNPDSPTIANLVIKLKHDIWKSISEKAKIIFKGDKKGYCDRYEFATVDPDDIRIFLYMIGYCDDNSKFISASNEEDLIFLVKYYIQLAGNLSMVTKIGRKSSKCDVHFFNISAKLAIKLQKCWSTAWSFIHDSPIEEQVPYKIFLQEEEMTKFYDLVNFNNLSIEEQEQWNKIIKPKAHKHLGLLATLQGNTSLSSAKTIEKMHNRLLQLKIRHMDPPAQRKCANMLVNSMHSFVPLQNNHNQTELMRLDESLSHHICRRNGISLTDCKHRIFISEARGGLGFLSNLETDIISVARELEILLNGGGLDSTTLRGRAQAILEYDDNLDDEIANHVLQAIHKLGQYGIQLRDGRDDLVNDILRIIANQQNGFSVGDQNFKGGNGVHLGYGKQKLLKFSFGSNLHRLVRHLQNNSWRVDTYSSELSKSCNVSLANIFYARDEAGKARVEQFDVTFSYQEWTNFNNSAIETAISKDNDEWKSNWLSNSKGSTSKPAWKWTRHQLLESVGKHHKIEWTKHMISHNDINDTHFSFNTYTKYGKIMDFLYTRGSPIIISTDGSHDPYADKVESRSTSSALTICALDIRTSESLESQEWTHRPMIPLLCRNALDLCWR